MAVQSATIARAPTGVYSKDYQVATWNVMANGGTGAPLGEPDFIDRTIQVSGTWGAGGAVVWEGSNDGASWFTLSNPNGVALSLTANGMLQCNYTPLYSRPHVTGGDGTTQLTSVVTMRRFRSE